MVELVAAAVIDGENDDADENQRTEGHLLRVGLRVSESIHVRAHVAVGGVDCPVVCHNEQRDCQAQFNLEVV